MNDNEKVTWVLGTLPLWDVDVNDPFSVMQFLVSGGYSCVLEYSGKRAYIMDEDIPEDGQRWISATVAQALIADGAIALWRKAWRKGGYETYRPAKWVAAWNEEQARRKAKEATA